MASSHDAPSAPTDELGATIDAADARPVDAPEAGTEPRGEVTSLDYPHLETVPRQHYLLGTQISKGGVGRILAARDLRLGREVAIKELLPNKRDLAAHFEQEARITARLQHPAIIHLYEAGVWPSGEPFYAMPRVVGRSLDKVVAERTTLAARIGLVPNVIAVADALAYAHDQRVMHRDLKPANVLLGEFGETVVIDWGLAKDLRRPTDEKGEPIATDGDGAVVGTPAYMPPEQARGQHVDERTDVYAIGALLYTVLCGQAPYPGATSPRRVLERVLRGPPEPVRRIEPGVPADLVAIVEKAMARDPAARYPTAAELAADLKRFQTGQMVAAHHYSARERVRRALRRHRGIVLLSLAAAAVLAVVATVSVRRILAEKRTAEHRRAALLEEQGRTQLLAGRAGRALVYLDEALARGRDGGALWFLVADAMRPFETMEARLECKGEVHAVAYSPDGKHLVTGGATGGILWLVADRSIVAHLGPNAVRAVSYDPTGARVVTAGDDGVARVWDAERGTFLYETARHRGAILDVTFSQDGTLLATAGDDGTARVWDAATGAAIATLTGHDGAVRSVRISSDGLRVATASDDGTAGVWSSRGGDRWPLRGHAGRVTAARFSPDGRWVLTAGEDLRAVVWDPTTGRALLSLPHRGEVATAEWSNDGTRIVTASADHTARLWTVPELTSDQPAELRPDATLAGHSDIVLRAQFDASGGRVVTVGRDRVVRLWDAAGGVMIAQFEGHGDLVEAVAISPDGEHLVTASRDGTAQLWDARGGQRPPRDVGEEIRGLALSPDGATVVTGTRNGDLLVWRAGAVDPQTTARHHAPVTAVAFAPDGARLASGGEDGIAIVSDAADPEQHQRTLAHDRPVLAVAFSPDGQRLATGCADGAVRVWNAADGTLVRELRGHTGAVDAVAWSGDGARLASASTDGTARTWNATTGASLGQPVSIGGVAYSVSLSSDGTWAAVGGDGATPQVWRVDGGAGALSLEGPTSVVTGVAFSRDDTRLITAGVDGTLRIWDARSGKLLGAREGHHGPIRWNGLALDASGTLVASASDDGTVRFWDVRAPHMSPKELDRFVAERVPWCLDADDQPRRVTPDAHAGGTCDQRRQDRR